MVLNKKQKRNWIIVGVIFLVIILGVILFNFIDFGNQEGTTLSISQVPETQGEILDFCITKQGCIDFLKEQGMSDGFLEKNNLQINCLNNQCIIR